MSQPQEKSWDYLIDKKGRTHYQWDNKEKQMFRIDGRKVWAYNYYDALERLAELPEVYESDYLEDPEIDND